MKENLARLYTPFEKNGADWTEYPRPQLKRDSYISLTGEWELYSLLGGRKSYIGSICVPFAPEAPLSGIERKKQKGEKYIYKRTFSIDGDLSEKKLLIHFGAVDQRARVFINGVLAGEHTGGYLPFTVEGESLAHMGENTLEVEVTDELSEDLPYGKQREKRGGMWYTPICGIWQAVWLETVPKGYIERLCITPALSSVTVKVIGGEGRKVLTLKDSGESFEFFGDSITLDIPSPKNWTPEDPHLYYFTLRAGEDEIESYFALRTVSAKDGALLLNGKPYFFHGLLDQGYFPDGIYTPATSEGYRQDILAAKRLGFNMLRKHIKIEPSLFYHYCDKYGMIVFQDMVNSGKYHYVIDTVIPTIGLRRGITHRATKERRAQFEADCEATVALLQNHPSVCYYTVFNEGWGQYDADRIYKKLKALDSGRVWDATSGWFFEKESDVQSEHIYFRRLDLKRKSERPLVLSEFGGYSLQIEGHCYNLSKNYGYKSFKTKEELTEGLRDLYLSQVLPEIEKKGLCAAVLTQLTDVEDETNGLLTYDRQVTKPDEAAMQDISKKLFDAFKKRFIK